ncbi:MAG: hypothetical protein V1723_02050 [Candidatus Uhrbacteria bacterium]
MSFEPSSHQFELFGAKSTDRSPDSDRNEPTEPSPSDLHEVRPTDAEEAEVTRLLYGEEARRVSPAERRRQNAADLRIIRELRDAVLGKGSGDLFGPPWKRPAARGDR